MATEVPAVECGNCGNPHLVDHCATASCVWSVCRVCETFGTRSRWTTPRHKE